MNELLQEVELMRKVENLSYRVLLTQRCLHYKSESGLSVMVQDIAVTSVDHPRTVQELEVEQQHL